MPRAADPRGLIQRLVEEGANATTTLRMYREAGGKIGNQTWYRLFGEIENEQALGGIEEGRPLHLKPLPNEIMSMSTVRASGYLQRVQVMGREKDGNIITKTIDISTKELMSRRAAIERAVSIVENIPSETGRQTGTLPVAVVSAFYGGTYEMTPRE